MGEYMKVRWRYWSGLVFAGVLGLAMATAASAQVVVTVDGDTAYATISLTDNNGVTYDADVTIVFDSPENLTPQSLNLTAELVDPVQMLSRLPEPPCVLILCPPPNVVVDEAFPVMITVEPVDFPWLFTSGFDVDESGTGDLSFHNTYSVEVHTHDLEYTDNSPYRLFKAPVGGPFDDITTDVLKGSMRARGRGGAFSQFIVVNDGRGLLGVIAGKILALNLRIVAAALDDGLRLDLLALLAKVDALLLIDLVGALDALDELIALIDVNAGTNIANIWSAHHDVINDAGEMNSIADTLHFSMTRLAGAANP
jgi:hypothetical protein